MNLGRFLTSSSVLSHRLRSVALVFVVFAGGSGTSIAQSKVTAPAGWKLVWSDEFNGKTLDLKKWNVLIRETSKHGELQYYVPDEVYLENGYLRIRSQVRDYGGMHYTSGRLSTDQRFAPTYGRFEIRGRMPTGKGLWPAYWLYP
jgi:beta-glucanase (GH16 family)